MAYKKDILFSELNNVSVISVTETWPDQRTSDNNIALEGYVTYRRDRVGDCVYVHDNIFSKRRYDLEFPNLECVWIEINMRNKKLLIGTFNRPPNSSNATFLPLRTQ